MNQHSTLEIGFPWSWRNVLSGMSPWWLFLEIEKWDPLFCHKFLQFTTRHDANFVVTGAEFVVMTTSGATNDEKLPAMMTVSVYHLDQQTPQS